MISASHNPIEWNALKFIGPTGLFLEAAEGARCARWSSRAIPRATWDALGHGDRRRRRGGRGTSTRARAAVHRRRGDSARGSSSVALDCVRGAGAVDHARCCSSGWAARWRRSTSSRTAAFRGRRSRSPRTSASSNAGAGDAGPTSGSRWIRTSTGWRSCRTTGKAIGEDYTLALAARLVLRHRSGPVVTNLSTSRIVEDVARGGGGRRSIRAPVGEVNVAVRMRDVKARRSAGRGTAG